MRGLIIGRFQPFHKGHAEMVQSAKKYEIILVIGSAHQSYTFENPFTAGERYEMILGAMEEMGIERFHIIPVADINRYCIYAKHVAEVVPSFDVVLSNNPVIREIFEKEGYKVEDVPFYRREEYQGRIIRERIARGEKWEHLVPKSVAEYIKKIDGERRIKNLFPKRAADF